MTYRFVWFLWSSAFLLPWVALFVLNRSMRSTMWRTSVATSAFGLTEPVFVPRYWNPPSLFDLARTTGFDLESLIFSFAIGGIGVVLYDAVVRTKRGRLDAIESRTDRRHRWHRLALVGPLVLFVPLYFLPWNPIYPSLVCLTVGAAASVACRPDMLNRTLIGGVLFAGVYAVFMLALTWSAPGYIGATWNLPALSGLLVGGIPLEEILFGFTFGLYWSGVYEHVTWRHAGKHSDAPSLPARMATPKRGDADIHRTHPWENYNA